MLLRWVLTRDSEAVLSMVDDYGGVCVDLNTGASTPIQSQTWDDVSRAPAEENVRGAVLRAELCVIPAQEEIYSSLRRGELDGWARTNGSGDIVKVEPIQWAGLRFRAHDGHDIAVPVDSEQSPLPLPRSLADSLSGSVPATSMPTVWPDPLFPAEQAMRLWPPRPEAAGAPQSPASGELLASDTGELSEAVHFQLAPMVESPKEPDVAPTPSGEASPITASYADVKKAVEKRGRATECELRKAAHEALPGKQVPRIWVRKARDELFGKLGRTGRPKSPQ
jgi:hypothetical protein